jgi:hypothetical protein
MKASKGNGHSRGTVHEVDEQLFITAPPSSPTYEEFKHALDKQRRLFTTRNEVDEPHFHYAPEPPCGMYAHKYALENKPTSNRHPVVLYEFPPPTGKGTKKAQILLWDSLLTTFNDPLAGSRRATGFEKAGRLGVLFAERRVELLIISHLQNLVSPIRKRPLLTTFEHIVSVLQAEVKPNHVLFVGEYTVSQLFILQNAWVARRLLHLKFKS